MTHTHTHKQTCFSMGRTIQIYVMHHHADVNWVPRGVGLITRSLISQSWDQLNTGPVYKGANHVLKAISDHDLLSDWVRRSELCTFTSIANAVPITNRICALRGYYFVPTALIVPCKASACISKMRMHESRSERALRSQVLRIRLSRWIVIRNALFLHFKMHFFLHFKSLI